VANRLASRTHVRRAAVLVAALAAASGLAVYAGTSAGAAPAPSIPQVEQQVNSLQGKVDKLTEKYDAAGVQLKAAQAKLATVSKQADQAQRAYSKASATLASVAVSQYENHNMTSIAGLFTSGDPNAVLSRASLVLQVEGTDNLEAQHLLTMATELNSMKAQRQRTEKGIADLTAQYKQQFNDMSAAYQKQKDLLGNLTAEQQAQVTAATVGGTSTSANVTTTPTAYTGPTTTQADKAVAFAYAQIGKPYVWGATGPDAYDCSGLMYASWMAAGITLPRTTSDEWAGLPHIPMSDLQPGDLILYNGESHVAMYVGGGYIIDAPHTGAVVEKLPESTSWYADSVDGAVRP